MMIDRPKSIGQAWRKLIQQQEEIERLLKQCRRLASDCGEYDKHNAKLQAVVDTGEERGHDDSIRNLRATRADMLGTDDEEHYWHCHAAANYIELLLLERAADDRKITRQRKEIEQLRSALKALGAYPAALTALGDDDEQ